MFYIVNEKIERVSREDIVFPYKKNLCFLYGFLKETRIFLNKRVNYLLLPLVEFKYSEESYIDLLKDGHKKLSKEDIVLIRNWFYFDVNVDIINGKIQMNNEEFELSMAFLEFIENPIPFLSEIDRKSKQKIMEFLNPKKVLNEERKILFNMLYYHFNKKIYFKDNRKYFWNEGGVSKELVGIYNLMPFKLRLLI